MAIRRVDDLVTLGHEEVKSGHGLWRSEERRVGKEC